MKKKVFIPVSVLIGVMLLTLVATMTLFVAEPDRAHAQTATDDPNLSELEVAGAPDDAGNNNLLTGDSDFEVNTTTYTIRIPFVDSGVVVTPSVSAPTPENNNASDDSIIRVNGTVVASGAAHNVNLAGRAGMTTSITIHVTALAPQCYENVHSQGVPRAPDSEQQRRSGFAARKWGKPVS